MIEELKYPGELASSQQVHELAEEYRKAANLLLQLGRPGKPLTRRAIQIVGNTLDRTLSDRTFASPWAQSESDPQNAARPTSSRGIGNV
ncbi:hypothetical protein [Mesorhizobium sp. B2-4-6]|uniref:hypothetical protein n=1 Tax=Mesorhizobium sp. B2-4-6 TaxID=2589943 RepID=UPI0015E3786A|nr:hypothetical protein [Mesorhizobium sp. B2-4-6]